MVPGDEKLIRRLLQNTMENAFHCARTYVDCQVRFKGNTFCLEVSNDAQILSDEDLQNWGHKRRQRIITEKAGQPHTSLGLGSSIIVGVSRHLGGHARIEQILTERESISQITVFIDLPWLDPSTKISD
jgi:K+-sensing histidine kinase KdpD